jgi:hypothetical protein
MDNDRVRATSLRAVDRAHVVAVRAWPRWRLKCAPTRRASIARRSTNDSTLKWVRFFQTNLASTFSECRVPAPGSGSRQSGMMPAMEAKRTSAHATDEFLRKLAMGDLGAATAAQAQRAWVPTGRLLPQPCLNKCRC